MAEGGVLEKIAQSTRERVERLKRERPVSSLRGQPGYGRSPISLERALLGTGPSVIAEVKFKSPARGVLRPEASPAEAARLAGDYLAAGAAAVSILTEPEFFSGDSDYLAAARSAHPAACLLMKDFFIDDYQFELARACGADAILLIAALLGPGLGELLAGAKERGLSALVEVHDEMEAEAALAAGARVLGVNSRNLRTLKTDLDVSRRLAPLARKAAWRWRKAVCALARTLTNSPRWDTRVF